MAKALYDKIQYRLAGDCGLLVEVGRGINPDVNAKVRAMAAAIQSTPPKGVLEITPTYRSLLLTYDPAITAPEQICPQIESLHDNLDTMILPQYAQVEIPVCYGGEFGPDMANVMNSSTLSEEEIIHIHSSPEYLIYMVGFTPGFPFLGGLDPRLVTPRLATPRLKVPRGSVGIANDQTGMYPVDSPGGWQIIGRTPLNLFRPDRKNPFLYRAGDKIRFVPITHSEFIGLAEKEGTHEGI